MSRYASRETPRQQARDQTAYERERALGTQGPNERAGLEAAYARDRLKAIARGESESSLPPVQKGMDIGYANDRLAGIAPRGYDDAGGRRPLFDGKVGSRNPQAEAAANSAISRSAVPFNINSQNAAAQGAVAASPPSFQPTSGPLNLPNQKLSPNASQGERDASLAGNLAMAAPGGLNQFRTGGALQRATASPAAQPDTMMASNGVGKRVSDATGDALFGARTAQPGTNQFGTASVRTAPPGEALQPATITANGVSRNGPMDLAKARTDLQKRYPNVFVAGSPENTAFVQHAKQFGEESAHQNVGQLLSQFDPEAQTQNIAKAGPSMQDQETKPVGYTAPERAGQTVRSVGNAVQSAGNFVTSLPGRAASAIDRATSGFMQGVTGQPQNFKGAENVVDSARNFIKPKRTVDYSGIPGDY